MTIKERTVLTRRNFLKTTALTAGVMAVAGAAGCTSVSTDGEAAVQQDNKIAEEVYTSTCRGNCGGACALQGTVRDGKIVSTRPITFSKEYEGIDQGCVKGLANPLRLYGTHRLRYPMKQTGERGSDNWEQISWDEAIQLVADKFNAAFDEYGPASVCIQNGAGNKQAHLNSHPLQIDNNNCNYNMGVGITRFVKKTGATV